MDAMVGMLEVRRGSPWVARGRRMTPPEEREIAEWRSPREGRRVKVVRAEGHPLSLKQMCKRSESVPR